MRILWNLLKDYPQGLEGEGFVFVVDAVEQQKNNKILWSGGVRIGYHRSPNWPGFFGKSSSVAGGMILQANLTDALDLQGSINYRNQGFDFNSFPLMMTVLLYPLPNLYTGVGLGFDFLSDVPELKFEWHLAGGVEWPLASKYKLVGDFRYVFMNGSNEFSIFLDTDFFLITMGFLHSL